MSTRILVPFLAGIAGAALGGFLVFVAAEDAPPLERGGS